MNRRPPIVVVIILLAVVGAGIWYGYQKLTNKSNGELTASGTIESVTVNVSPEIAGKVKEVLSTESQSVKAGDELLTLDDSLLTAQRQVAQSGVQSAQQALLTAQGAYNLAQAQYDASLTAARAQQGAARLTDWLNRAPGRFDQPLWYFSRDEQIASAQTQVDAANQALQQSQADLDQVVKSLSNADFVAAETRLANARTSYLIAKTVYDHAQATGGKVSPEDINLNLPPFAPTYKIKINIAKNLSGDSDVVTAAKDAFDEAQTELDDAQTAYNALLNTDAADRVQEARANVAVAQERYEVAQDTLSKLQTGENSPQVKIAELALGQAKAALDQAQSAVNTAQANLGLLDTQMKKLTVYAPMDGTILTRNVEPGEFVQPGAAALTMANLGELTITVYVPEDQYGKIKLGQQATVSVDTFPGQTFQAEVVHIADQAEFTPRNVQTVEGRSATVYAIKLKVTDPHNQLKIGMPADVTFQ
jgi:multidrug resistance efflux pump